MKPARAATAATSKGRNARRPVAAARPTPSAISTRVPRGLSIAHFAKSKRRGDSRRLLRRGVKILPAAKGCSRVPHPRDRRNRLEFSPVSSWPLSQASMQGCLLDDLYDAAPLERFEPCVRPGSGIKIEADHECQIARAVIAYQNNCLQFSRLL